MTDWQKMSIQDGFANLQLAYTPFAQPSANLGNGKSLYVLLPSLATLSLKITSVDNKSPTSAAKDFLQLDVSETPGAALLQTIKQRETIIAPAIPRRIIKITNSNFDSVKFELLLGQPQRPVLIPPITWLTPENSEAKRFNYSNGQMHRFFQSSSKVTLPLQQDKTYWMESVLQSSFLWNSPRVDYYRFQKQQEEPVTEVYVPLFQNNARATQIESTKFPFTRMLPSIFTASETGDAAVTTLGTSFFRAQTLQEDWLFDNNYESYVKPALAQQQQKQKLRTQLLKQQFKAGDISSYSKIAALSHEHRELNRWLTYSVLPGKSNHGFQESLMHTQMPSWVFPDNIAQDVAPETIAIGGQNNKSRFIQLDNEQSVEFAPTQDIATNQIRIQMQLPATNTPGKGKGIDVSIDDSIHSTILPFSTEKLQHLVKHPDWIIDAEKHSAEEISAVTIQLPANWKKLSITSHLDNAKIRVLYQTHRTPKLDGSQWLPWLAKGYQDATVQLDADWLLQHPHRQEYQRYIELKIRQFQKNVPAELWQQLISGKVPDSTLFDQELPTSLGTLKQLQKALLAPVPNQWQYWKNLGNLFANVGWEGFQSRMLKTIIQQHTEPQILHSAMVELLLIYARNANTAAAIELLTAIVEGQKYPSDLRGKARVRLARLFLLEGKADYTLFTLTAQDISPEAKSLKRLASEKLAISIYKMDASDTEDSDIALQANSQVEVTSTFVKEIDSAATVLLNNIELGVAQTNYLLLPGSPLKITTSAAAKLKLTARQWFTAGHRNHDWLTISNSEHNTRLPIFYSDYRSENLRSDIGEAGLGHRFDINIPAQQTVEIRAKHTPMIISVQEFVTASQLHQENKPCSRQYTGKSHDAFWKAADTAAINCIVNEIYPGSHTDINESMQIMPHYMPELTPKLISALSLLHTFENRPSTQLLAQLNNTISDWQSDNWLGDNWLGKGFSQKLLRRLNKDAQWQALGYPLQAKKLTFYTGNTNQPLSPFAYRNKLLYYPYLAEWERLSDKSSLNYDLSVAKGEQFQLVLLSQSHLFFETADAAITVSVDGKILKQSNLPMGGTLRIPLLLQPGQQQLKIALENVSGQSSVLAKLQFKKEGKQWHEQPQQVRLRLFQSDKEEPYQIYLPEDAWLRMDTFSSSGLIGHRYILAPKGLFSWYATDSDPDQLGHRLYKLNLSSPAISATVQPPQDMVTRLRKDPAPWLLTEYQELSTKPEDTVSWGTEFSIRQNRSPDEDSAQKNRYGQLGLYYQDSDFLRKKFIRYGLNVRNYNDNFKNSYHGNISWWNTQWQDQVQLNLAANFAYQEGFVDNDSTWSGRIQGALHWQYSLNQRFFNRFGVSGFYQFIDADKIPQQFASSVYSQYKLDHRHGVRLYESMQYRWTHDAQSWLKLSLNTNPLSHAKWLDNTVAEIGSRLFYQGIVADVSWQWRHFSRDNDRSASSDENRLGIGFEWFVWDDREHYRLRAGYEHNMEIGENYWYLRLSFNRSGKRGVADYLPQSLAFPALRQQEATLHLLDAAQAQAAE